MKICNKKAEIPPRDYVVFLKKKFVKGTRIRLLEMVGEDYIPSGSLGTVTGVDDIGTIHMNWDYGSSLGLVPNVDKFEVLGPDAEEKQNAEND